MKKQVLFIILFAWSIMVSPAFADHNSLEYQIIKTRAAIDQCVEMRQAEYLDSHLQSAECGNIAIEKYILPVAPFPDFVKEFMTYRLEMAKKTDQGDISWYHAQKMIHEKRNHYIKKGIDLQKAGQKNGNEGIFQALE